MILEALLGTPWWVYLVFLYLLKVGVGATKTHVVSVKKLFVIPVVFWIHSMTTILFSFQFSQFSCALYSFSLLCGMGGGWLLISNLNLKFDKYRGLIQVPGNWSTITLIMFVLSAKYYFGYSLAVNPEISQDPNFKILMLTVSGVCSGVFLGRLFCFLFRNSNALHENFN